MAVVSVTPRATKAATAVQKGVGKTSYTVVYRVKTSDPEDGPAVVLSAPDLPQMFDSYSFGNDDDELSFLVSREPKQISENTEWEVTCTYEPSEQTQETPPTANPLEIETKVEIGSQTFQRDVEVAQFLGLSGGAAKKLYLGPQCAPIALAEKANRDFCRPQSSSGEPFSPHLARDDSIMLVRITRPQLFLPSSFLQYRDVINSDNFTITSKRLNLPVFRYTAKMNAPIASQQQAAMSKADAIAAGILSYLEILASNANSVMFVYWIVTYELAIHPKNWDLEIADMGYRQAMCPGDDDGSGGIIPSEGVVPVNPVVPASLETHDPHGVYFANPQALDGHGKLLASGVVGANQQSVFSNWRIYEALPFALLNL